MNGFGIGAARCCVRWLLVLCWWILSAGTASAFTAPPNFIGTTFEGCRNNGSIVLPIAGKFICPDAAYTSGNLGKGWNELDLVPFHLITSSGNSAGPLTTYNIYIAADYRQGTLGYDFISVPTVNPVSDASCTVSAGPQTVVTGITGGTDETVYRLLTISQLQGKTCRFDWYQRLALGAAQFSGSNLQAYTFDQDGLSGGKRTIPIPVNQIAPQKIAKDMTATQGSDHAWSVTKSPTPNSVDFGDVCRPGAPASLPVQITVTWTKFAAVPGGPITVITHVYATNPAARAITTSVTDAIYSGTTLLDTSPTATLDVPANTTILILTHTYTAAAGTTDFNDIATGTYTDTVTGVPIPGTTTATASAPVQNTGPELDASAAIADLEQLSGAALTFSVAQPSLGAFQPYPTASDPAYVAGTPTTGPVAWGVTDQPDSGSVTFDKAVYLAGKTITTGTLSDVANLAGIDGFVTASNPVSIGISSSATVKFTLSKSIPVVLGAGESIVVKFHVTAANDPSVQIDKSFTFVNGGPTTLSTDLSGLAPDTYIVNETSATFFYPGGPAGGVPSNLQPDGGAQKTINLSAVNGVVGNCSGSVVYVNNLPATVAAAQVQKITNPVIGSGDPDYTWTFTLSGPILGTVTVNAGANAGYVDFGIPLTALGTYTVTETQKTPAWVLTSAVPGPTPVCTFVLTNLDVLNGAIKQCTFTNTKQGKARVIKTVLKQAPSGTQSFTFQLRQGATLTTVGTILDQQNATSVNGGTINFAPFLVPGNTYQICEIVMPGWLTTLGTFVPGSFNPPDGVAANPAVDNSILCGNFTVAAGETKVFTVDNSPPPGGRALTIGFWKNWASCKKSGGNQAPVLDQTMAKAEPTGIQYDSLYLHGSTATPNVAPDCAKAVNLLSKQNFNGVNQASDPLFNMAAQLIAAELNYTAGAYKCPLVTDAIAKANALLTKYSFNGTGYTGKLSASDASLANSLAKRLDDYNNNRASACQ